MACRVFGYVELSCGQSAHQFLHIYKYGIILILHVVLHLDRVVIIEFEYQERHIIHIIAVDGLNEFAAYGGQNEITEIGMGTLKILNDSRQWNGIGGIVLSCYQIRHGQKGLAVNSVITAYLIYGTVTESELNSETADYKQHQIVVFYQVPHFVLWDIFRRFYTHILI